MEKSKAGTEKEVPTAYHILIKYINNEHNMEIFYKKMEKV